jgi:hypothetical protein
MTERKASGFVEADDARMLGAEKKYKVKSERCSRYSHTHTSNKSVKQTELKPLGEKKLRL